MDVKADDIPGMCAESETFADAVWIACASRRRNGRMHTHQTKVSVDARREFGYRIIAQYDWDTAFGRGKDFDRFYDKLWEIRPAGIGPLTTYDVATRLGAFLKLEPTMIYLHTGARLGWDAMWGASDWPRTASAVWRVPPVSWPEALRQLSADMAEDFLCTYRDALTKIRRDESGFPI